MTFVFLENEIYLLNRGIIQHFLNEPASVGEELGGFTVFIYTDITFGDPGTEQIQRSFRSEDLNERFGVRISPADLALQTGKPDLIICPAHPAGQSISAGSDIRSVFRQFGMTVQVIAEISVSDRPEGQEVLPAGGGSEITVIVMAFRHVIIDQMMIAQGFRHPESELELPPHGGHIRIKDPVMFEKCPVAGRADQLID